MRKICQSKTVKITNDLSASYQLILEDRKYSIICVEENNRTDNVYVEKASKFTSCTRNANRIFNLIVKNRACGGTINDIICDQMCWFSEQPLKIAVFSFFLLQNIYFYCII